MQNRKARTTLTWAAVAGLMWAALAAGPALAGAETPEQVLYIRAGRLVDVVAGVVRADQAIVVRGERIAAVGPAGDVSVPDGARVIDLSAATVLPGLLDSHVHLTGSPDYHGFNALGVSLPRQAIKGVANARATLLAGFTTVRNVGAGGYTDIALRDGIDDGDVIGPRMLVAGEALGITGGHCDENLLPAGYQHSAGGVADGPWAVRAKVRENIKYGATVIKFCGTGGVLSKGTALGAQQYTFEEMAALVDEAHMHGRKVAVHAHGLAGIKTAIRAGVDSVEHASYIDAEAIAMAIEHGTYLSMDIYVSDYILSEGEKAGILAESLAKERVVGAIQRRNFAAAVEAGAKIAFGTDAGVYEHGLNGRQFAYMVKYGMTPMQAIQAATVNAARLFGMEEQVGALAAGHFADLIAVTGDPLANVGELEDVDFVMKGGVVYKDQRAGD